MANNTPGECAGGVRRNAAMISMLLAGIIIGALAKDIRLTIRRTRDRRRNRDDRDGDDSDDSDDSTRRN